MTLCAVITNPMDVEHARRLGAEALEFRFDMFDCPVDDFSFIKQPETVIFTCHKNYSDEAYQELLEKAIMAGADFVDIDAGSRIRDSFPNKTICSYHDYEKTPRANTILSIFDDLKTSGIPKAAFMVKSARDLVEIADAASALRKTQAPFILIGMGEVGAATRIRFDTLGSFMSYFAVDEKSKSAAGQLTLKDAAKLGLLKTQDKRPVLCGVIGYPLETTFSPAIHNAAMDEAGINGAYLRIPTPADELECIPRLMNLYDIRGLNVTIPHKKSVIPLLQVITNSAEKMQAVNTIIRYTPENTTNTSQSILEGDNTDWLGVSKTLDPYSPAGKNILLLGAGGAASAAAYYLLLKGASFTIANRTKEKAAQIAEQFSAIVSDATNAATTNATTIIDTTINATTTNAAKINVVDIEELTPSYDIVINASSVFSVDAKKVIKKGCIAFDMRYTDSDFLDAAKDLGGIPISGMKMLISQGAASFKRWHEMDANALIMKQAFIDAANCRPMEGR